MAYSIKKSKDESREQLKLLLAAFTKEYAVYKDSKYSEAQLRIDFINPLLKTFGWDVDNEASHSQFFRDVLQEEPIDVEEDFTKTKKNPDYTIRIQGSRKFFIEAKRVSIDLETSNTAAFQTRRYGWNANLGISILTNFEKIIIYDCRYKPNANDTPNVARYSVYNYTKFLEDFDKLYEVLSYESVASGYVDEYFSLTNNELTTFDNYFLKQIEQWRYQLATNIVQNNHELTEEDINFLIQRLLNRIIFLRICEDREIEKFETLKSVKDYDDLKALFLISDKKYNSGLFDFIEDNFSLKIILAPEILISIFNELYYPESPYDFSVVDPAILSQIYERYLGSKIIITNPNEIQIVEEPEVAASSGVVPTPKNIVKTIVRESLEGLFDGKDFQNIQKLKIADICCGSGTFLISVYDFIIEKITLALLQESVIDNNIIIENFDGSHSLTLKTKQDFISNLLYGVDINPYAVEVTKFSLYLKLLENENSGSIENFLVKYKQRVLPSLDSNIKTGNSLTDENFFKFDPSSATNYKLLYQIKPFNWTDEFPFLNKTGGFDAVVGNPPYVRIQNMVKYLSEGIKYYQSATSGYTVSKKDTFDKYYLFIERALTLLNENGVLGYIVPNKFFIVQGGKALRHYLVSHSSIQKIIHFGVTQVFPNRSTYTAIVILDKIQREKFKFVRIKNISMELNRGSISYCHYDNASFNEMPWIFLSEQSKRLFEKLCNTNTIPLTKVAEICVGLQTSADPIYIFKPDSETETTFKFKNIFGEFEVEKEICKPCLHDLSFDLFDTISPNAELIFPYNIVSNKAEAFSEKYFSEKYPLAWAYLNNFKEKLAKRSINGSKHPKWYQFGRSQSLTKFHDSPKLIWPVLSTHASYSFDEKNLQFTGGGNGPYYSLLSRDDYSPLYLLGIISHPVFEAMVKARASEFRGAYYSHGKQFIQNLPIRKIDFTNPLDKQIHDEIVSSVKLMISTKESLLNEHIASKKEVLGRQFVFHQKKLITLVNEAYQISEDEISSVLADETIIVTNEE
jgi:hypothetical protein